MYSIKEKLKSGSTNCKKESEQEQMRKKSLNCNGPSTI